MVDLLQFSKQTELKHLPHTPVLLLDFWIFDFGFMSISSSLNMRFFHAMTHFHKRIVMIGFSLIHAYQMKF